MNLQRLRSRSVFVHEENTGTQKKERRKKSKTQKHKDTIDRKNKQQKDTKNIKIP